MPRPSLKTLQKAVYDGCYRCKCGLLLELDTYTCGECGRDNPVAHELGL